MKELNIVLLTNFDHLDRQNCKNEFVDECLQLIQFVHQIDTKDNLHEHLPMNLIQNLLNPTIYL